MRDLTIIKGFEKLQKEINDARFDKNKFGREIVVQRLQLNAIVRLLKIFYPLYLIYCWMEKIEDKAYNKKVEEYKKIMEGIKEEKFDDKKVEIKKEETGRNDKCTCGSGKKYKKCCLDKKQEKENGK